MLWVGMDGHRSLLMGVVWVWVQFEENLRLYIEYQQLKLKQHLPLTWFLVLYVMACTSGRKEVSVNSPHPNRQAY